MSKIVVAMSGGVDSSVVAALLKKQGHECIGIHLHFWTDPTGPEVNGGDPNMPQNKCCSVESLEHARGICKKLDMPFYVINLEKKFKETIVDYFLDEYADGKTPNPCVECNRSIKFGALLKVTKELGADYLATGHYVRKKEIQRNGQTIHELHIAKDLTKDQTYFLYTLTQDKLKHLIFPLGEFTKADTYAMAKEFGLTEVENKKDSQNLCFYGDKKYTDFLKRYLSREDMQSGDIITTQGKKIGKHEGLPLYTIGQRKGIGGGNEAPMFVIDLDKKNNAVIVGEEKDLYQDSITVDKLNFLDGQFPAKPLKLETRIRYRFRQQSGTLKINTPENTDAHSSSNSNAADSAPNSEPNSIKAIFQFDKPVRAITKGQSAVFYDGEKLVGGGIIS